MSGKMAIVAVVGIFIGVFSIMAVLIIGLATSANEADHVVEAAQGEAKPETGSPSAVGYSPVGGNASAQATTQKKDVSSRAAMQGVGFAQKPYAASQNVTPFSVPTGITVTGRGVIPVVPDALGVTFYVYNESTQIADAINQNSAATEAVLNAIRGNGIEDRHIQTKNYSVTTLTDYQSGRRITVGYAASSTIDITIVEISEASAILSSILDAGGTATSLYGMNWHVERPGDYAAELRRLAIEDARAKADEAAALLGISVGAPINVQISGFGGRHNNTYSPAVMEASMSSFDMMPSVPSLEAGEQELSMTVDVLYGIVVSE